MIFLQLKDDQKEKYEKFWALNTYVAGSYDTAAHFQALDKHIEGLGKNGQVNRLFYLALPPTVYASVSSMVKKNCMAKGYEKEIHV